MPGLGPASRQRHQLQAGRTEAAVALFKPNGEAYPGSWNACGSLAEAYVNLGDREAAIRNHERSIEINAGNTNGKEQMQCLSECK